MARPQKHLLILSDDESIRRLFCDAFGEAVECEGVDKASEALARLKERHYPVVVLDLSSRGATAVLHFFQKDPLAKRPLIFVLADDATKVPQKLDPKVVSMVIAKPFDTADIQAIIRQTLVSLASVASEDTLRDLERISLAPAPQDVTVPAAESEDVLVVDDDRAVLNLFVVALEREKLKPDTASDGDQAIAKLRKKRYCALVLDLMMPKRSGWDVIDWLKKHQDKIPFSVIVSTAADRAVLHELDPDIVNAIFVKPFNALELAAYVRACSRLRSRDRRRKRLIGTEREIRR